MSNSSTIGTRALTHVQKINLFKGNSGNLGLKSAMKDLIELGSDNSSKSKIIQSLRSLVKTIQDNVNNGESINNDITQDLKGLFTDNPEQEFVDTLLRKITDWLQQICRHQNFGFSWFGVTRYTKTAEFILVFLDDIEQTSSNEANNTNTNFEPEAGFRSSLYDNHKQVPELNNNDDEDEIKPGFEDKTEFKNDAELIIDKNQSKKEKNRETANAFTNQIKTIADGGYIEEVTSFLHDYSAYIYGDSSNEQQNYNELVFCDLSDLIKSKSFAYLSRSQRVKVYKLQLYYEYSTNCVVDKKGFSAGADQISEDMERIFVRMTGSLSTTNLKNEFLSVLINFTVANEFLYNNSVTDLDGNTGYSKASEIIKKQFGDNVFLKPIISVDNASSDNKNSTTEKPFFAPTAFVSIRKKYDCQCQTQYSKLQDHLLDAKCEKGYANINLRSAADQFWRGQYLLMNATKFDVDLNSAGARNNITKILSLTTPHRLTHYSRNISHSVAIQYIVAVGFLAFDAKGKFDVNKFREWLFKSNNMDCKHFACVLTEDYFKGISLLQSLVNNQTKYSIVFPQSKPLFRSRPAPVVVKLSPALDAKFIEQQQQQQVIDCMLEYLPSQGDFTQAGGQMFEKYGSYDVVDKITKQVRSMSPKELKLAYELTLSIRQKSDDCSQKPIIDMLSNGGEELVYELYRPDVDPNNIVDVEKVSEIQDMANKHLSPEVIQMLHFADAGENSKESVSYDTIFNIVGKDEFVHPIVIFLTNPSNDNYKKSTESEDISIAKITAWNGFIQKAKAYDYCQETVRKNPKIRQELSSLYSVFPTFGGRRNRLCPTQEN